jgi:hypothetical protein
MLGKIKTVPDFGAGSIWSYINSDGASNALNNQSNGWRLPLKSTRDDPVSLAIINNTKYKIRPEAIIFDFRFILIGWLPLPVWS